MEQQSIAFLTWPSALHPDWVMVHPCSHATYTGVLAFPGGPQTHGEVVKFREHSFPVPKTRVEAALKMYVRDSLKLTDDALMTVESRGIQGDYVVTYRPKPEADQPVVRNPNWKDHLDDFQRAALDMADATEKLRREYGPHGEHPEYNRDSWQHEVGHENVQIGYWEWMVHRLEEAAE